MVPVGVQDRQAVLNANGSEYAQVCKVGKGQPSGEEAGDEKGKEMQDDGKYIIMQEKNSRPASHF